MAQNQNRTLLEEAQTLLSETTQAYADVRKQLSKEDRRQIKGYLSDMRKYLSRASRGSIGAADEMDIRHGMLLLRTSLGGLRELGKSNTR